MNGLGVELAIAHGSKIAMGQMTTLVFSSTSVQAFPEARAIQPSTHMNHHLTTVREIAVLPQIETLPGSQNEATVGDRNLLGGARDRRADMGGHIVGAFRVVDIAAAVLGDKLGEEIIQVAQHIGVGVFLDDQTGRGVAHEYGAKPGFDLGLGNDRLDLLGNVVQAFGLSLDFEELLHDRS